MRVYCIDTSSLIAAWQERYPIENFPSFWTKLDELIDDGRLIAPIEVLNEMKKRSDELHTWLKARPKMFRELDDAVQIAAARCLVNFPGLSASASCARQPIPLSSPWPVLKASSLSPMRSRPAALPVRTFQMFAWRST